MSRYESTLLNAIKAERHETRRTVFQLVWAAYRVRVGDYSAAREVVHEARLKYSKNHYAQVFAHINFVEGLCEFFERGIESALPKLARSKALSSGCPQEDSLPALTRAWMAGLYRNLGEWNSMVDFLISAATCCDRLPDDACCRLSLVVADAFQEVESYGQANKWYSVAHNHALALGDDAVIGAILYNKAAIRIFNLRLAEVAGGEIDTVDGRVALEAASAKNYTQYVRDLSMQWGFDLMSAQLLLLRRDHESALAQLDSGQMRELRRNWPAVDLVRRADVFRCAALIGELKNTDAGAVADEAWMGSDDKVGDGDKAIAAYSLSIGLSSLDKEASEAYRVIALDALRRFDSERRIEATELARFVSASRTIRNLSQLELPTRSANHG